jgi:hypothetical protein
MKTATIKPYRPAKLPPIKAKNLDTIISPEWLRKHDACTSGHDWALPHIGVGITLKKLLPLFDRSDWMLWTLRKADAMDKAGYVQAAILCAEEVLHIYENRYPEDMRPRDAIKAAIAYVKEPTEVNRKAAAADAYAAADDAAYAAAAYAAAAAAYAADAYAADAYAADAYAADAAAYAAAADAYADAAAAEAADAEAADAAYAAAAARKEMHKTLCAKLLSVIR